MVTEGNNNKFYNLKVVGSTLTCEWGRVGCATSTQDYSANEFEKILKNKIKKGYVDVTQLKEEKSAGFDFTAFCKESKSIFNTLLDRSRHFIADKFVSSNFTQAQIDKIESILDKIKTESDAYSNKKNILELFFNYNTKITLYNLQCKSIIGYFHIFIKIYFHEDAA